MPQLQTIPCDRASTVCRMPVDEAVPKGLDLSSVRPQQFTQTHSDSISIKLLPPQKTRKRGVVLTEQGWQKLLQAGVLCNEFGERYTFDHLSEQTLLDPRTICRILGREIAIDKRSLKIFFNTFSLDLVQDDYTTPMQGKRKQEGAKERYVSAFPFRPTLAPDSTLSPDVDTASLKQQIIDTCHRFIQLHNLDSVGCITLSIKFVPQTSPQLELNF